MSKGEGRKIGIKFTSDLVGDISGNESAFTVLGKEYKYVNGPLIDKTYQVDKVERYPVPILYEDDFQNGNTDGTEVTPNGITLSTGEGGGGGYTSDLTGGMTYISTSEFSSAYANYMAFDNNESTSWSASGTDNQAVGVNFGAPKVIRKLRVLTNGRLRNFALEGSNDNSTWTEVYGGTQLSNSSWQEYTFENTASYQYYRVKCTGALYTGSNVMITEIEMMEQLSAYLEEGTYTTTLATSLPETPRIRFNTNEPTGTSVTVEYATNNSNATEPTAWEAVNDSDLLTINGDYLWFRCTLGTDDESVTPILTRLWLEESTAPQDTILLTIDNFSRFTNIEGDLTITYDASNGTLAGVGGAVESFTQTFTPTDLVPEPNPGIQEYINAVPSIELEYLEVEYMNAHHTESISASPVSLTLEYTHIDDVNP